MVDGYNYHRLNINQSAINCKKYILNINTYLQLWVVPLIKDDLYGAALDTNFIYMQKMKLTGIKKVAIMWWYGQTKKKLLVQTAEGCFFLTNSLVGSWLRGQALARFSSFWYDIATVSYTHLTLPTILLV